MDIGSTAPPGYVHIPTGEIAGLKKHASRKLRKRRKEKNNILLIIIGRTFFILILMMCLALIFYYFILIKKAVGKILPTAGILRVAGYYR
ncbi:MAG: hypothetical protein A2031_02190 [Deltaproteobacteria bacterium RBG_19FT_COMBO_43_11]|nr:MAG: hypothetical protein A2W27_05385 [Deltaproteobacteria bacterium RBG_16_44_11]OGP91394.1 MAG: hypothetical protein A2031_02190 [Deltaproteobacteria bacterium RBG_19FT_COMBO_43_11]